MHLLLQIFAGYVLVMGLLAWTMGAALGGQAKVYSEGHLGGFLLLVSTISAALLAFGVA